MSGSSSTINTGCLAIVMDISLIRVACYRSHRQADAKYTAAAKLAFHVNGAAVVADDCIAGRQTEAGSLADRLSRKEWFEHTVAVLRSDAATVVADFERDFIFRNASARRYRSAAVAGLDRIRQYVQKHLIDFAGMAQKARQRPEIR